MKQEPVRATSTDWCRDELILALDVYFRLDGAVPGPRRPEILELSALLRTAGLYPASALHGSIGDSFIECHHRRPRSDLRSKQRTALDDLALVCANCHRMMHGRRPWITVEQLRLIVTNRAEAAEVKG